MTFIAPGYLTAAIAAACAMAALHLIVLSRPRSAPFPTARFAPEDMNAARSRSLRFSDLVLLLLRMLAILCVGAALARPAVPPHRERVARVIMADMSGSTRSIVEVRDSVKAQFRPGDAIVEFDTSARAVAAPGSIQQSSPGTIGSLSAGLIAARRAASAIRVGADSVELVIVSPAMAREQDRATAALRAGWPGRARLVRVAPAEPSAAVNIVASVRFATTARPLFSVARNRVDTVGAAVAGDNVITGSFERRWRYPGDSLAGRHVTARWIDGEPAAVARRAAGNCDLSIAVPIDSSGDLALRPELARFEAALAASCSPPADSASPALQAALEGSGNLAAAASFGTAIDADSPIARWLAIVAIVLAVAEMVLRRARSREPVQ